MKLIPVPGLLGLDRTVEKILQHLMGSAAGRRAGAFWRKGWWKDRQEFLHILCGGLLVSNGSSGGLFSVFKLLHVAEPPSISYQRLGGIVPGLPHHGSLEGLSANKVCLESGISGFEGNCSVSPSYLLSPGSILCAPQECSQNVCV